MAIQISVLPMLRQKLLHKHIHLHLMDPLQLVALRLRLQFGLLDLLDLVQPFIVQLLHLSPGLRGCGIRRQLSDVLVSQGVLKCKSCLLVDMLG